MTTSDPARSGRWRNIGILHYEIAGMRLPV
jgi:hypothetical protein